ncbi:MAG: alpha-amylase/4-alpha-glucanotransferase domain-containing protein [Pirellulaceae bacterium]
MPNAIRFCLVLHNHQPVGNFDNVFEQSYQDSYRPFLDVFDRYHDLKFSLHTSGSLMEWLDQHHGDYVDRLAGYVAAGRLEIVGGAFYEPILAMIPPRDRVGQITRYSRWLESRLGCHVQGMWIPERVWEQSMTSDIARAGIRYTVLDDFHFRNAGLREEQLHGYYVTEDDGNLVCVFPGSERLRYLIPFASPEETIEHLRQIAEQHPNAVVVFGDDGEKFGTWPDTKAHVYEHGWLSRFFDLLTENRDWLKTTTLSDAVTHTPPVGKIYLPEGSYREMTEWALPAALQNEYEDIAHQLHDDPRWHQIQRFVRGGYWRNFKVKYPETDEMYSRMIAVSRRLQEAERAGGNADLIDQARRELYRGQCNCSYWHGAFGGAYLPHLRNAVFNHLIAADNLIDRAIGRPSQWVELDSGDFDLDGLQEISLSNEHLHCLISPHRGGQMYELDVRSICHNLGATLTRRQEAYHRKVMAGNHAGAENCASIHDRVVFKQEGLDQRLQYDVHPRKSFIDFFFPLDISSDQVERGEWHGTVSLAAQQYEARLRRKEDRKQAQMTTECHIDGCQVRITKGLTLDEGSNTLQIAYMLEGLPQDRPLHFGIEMNFAGLPAGADDRYFFGKDHQNFGQLGTRLDLQDVTELGLVDQWLGIQVQWDASRPTNVWTFPVETVSQSEGGFELVHQSVCVIPHWHVVGDQDGRWVVTMNLALDTSLAESRMESREAVQVG